MIVRNLLTIIASIFISQFIFAQEVWTLERCVRYAQDNSRTVKQSQVQVKSAQLSNKLYRMQVYPTVSAGSNLGLNFGRSVNPSTYSFQTSTSSYNSWSLNASVPIYQGGLIRQEISQTDAEVQAINALGLDPFSLMNNWGAGWTYWMTGDYNRMSQQGRKL